MDLAEPIYNKPRAITPQLDPATLTGNGARLRCGCGRVLPTHSDTRYIVMRFILINIFQRDHGIIYCHLLKGIEWETWYSGNGR